MPRSNSLPSLRAQIAKLEAQAEAIKKQVVSRLQREIKSHGLTAEDLFGPIIVGNGRKPKDGTAVKAPSPAKREAKYGDDSGNVWGGMGKRPDWLRERLEAGASLEEFLLAGRPSATAAKRAKGSASNTSAEAPADVIAKPTVKVRKATPGRKKAAAKPAKKTRTPRKTVARAADAAE